MTAINIFAGDIDEMALIIGKPLLYGSTIFHYAVLFLFIYLFWRNYKQISVNQPTRSLMKSILRTRKTMKLYIWYNLVYIMITGLLVVAVILFTAPVDSELINSVKYNEDPTLYILKAMFFVFILLLIACGLFYGFYRV